MDLIPLGCKDDHYLHYSMFFIYHIFELKKNMRIVRTLAENVYLMHFISSPEPKAQGELIVWDSSWHVSTLSNMNISETSQWIVIKFYLEHHWGGGLTALAYCLQYRPSKYISK